MRAGAKPVVRYAPSHDDHIEVGLGACVVPVDHPDSWEVTNGQPVITSTVIELDYETGLFETLNTVYVRVVQ